MKLQSGHIVSVHLYDDSVIYYNFGVVRNKMISDACSICKEISGIVDYFAYIEVRAVRKFKFGGNRQGYAAEFIIGFGIVAENNKVCLSSGKS